MTRATLALLMAAAMITPPITGAQPPPSSTSPVQERQRAGTDGWSRATPSRPVQVPADHVAHPAYRLEWWYYTGNLTSDDGRAYGFQATFFRVGIDRTPTNPSTFAVRDLYMAHVAVTDVVGRRHHFADRINRAGVSWAGAHTDRYEVWNENWRATLDEHGRHHVTADAGAFAIELTLAPGKPPVLQGDRGYSRKGQDPGNASHYYSLTRMPTTGTLRLGTRTWRVRGNGWMDHEFGTSALEPGTRGWDWFALQLADGRELMLYRLRQDDGRAGPFSSGTLVDGDGQTLHLDVSDFSLEPTRTWRSPESGATYPVAWDVRVPKAGLTLKVDAVVDAQELRTRRSTNVTYWEGAVRVAGQAADRSGSARGSAGSQQVEGVGYLEMTGYSGARMSDVMR